MPREGKSAAAPAMVEVRYSETAPIGAVLVDGVRVERGGVVTVPEDRAAGLIEGGDFTAVAKKERVSDGD